MTDPSSAPILPRACVSAQSDKDLVDAALLPVLHRLTLRRWEGRLEAQLTEWGQGDREDTGVCTDQPATLAFNLDALI